MKKSKRLILHVNEIMCILSVSNRTARRLMSRIKEHYKKQNSKVITVNEFCEFMGVKRIDVEESLD